MVNLARRLRTASLTFDVVLVGATVAVAVLGLLMVGSATRPSTGPALSPFAARQLLWVGGGTAVMAATMAVDLHVLRRCVPLVYTLALLGLAAVLSPLGTAANGAQAWFDLGPIRVQPAELAKPVLVVALAAHGARAQGHLDAGRLLGALLLAGVPLGLVLLQPDLGTAAVLMVVTAAVVVSAGARLRHLAALGVVGLLALVGVVGAGMLEPYQVDRLTSFVHQSADPLGTSWNLEQAKIAIGSGGITGAGLFQGRQTAGDFVPESHTDFVFTVVAEELGLLGGATLLALFALVAWRTWRAAWQASDSFGALICAGVLAMVGFQVFQNMGMAMGITPITGIPLPLVSYGGSSTIACFAAIGLVANVSRRRPGLRNLRAVGKGLLAARLGTS